MDTIHCYLLLTRISTCITFNFNTFFKNLSWSRIPNCKQIINY